MPRALAAEPPESALTAEQRQQISALIVEFRKTRDAPQVRQRIAEEITEFGEIASRQLLALVNKELGGQLRQYGGSFRHRAMVLSGARVARVNPAEVMQMRDRVLKLKERDELTQQMIVSQADPVLAKLREMFVLDRSAVIERFPDLEEQRQELLEVGRYWEICLAQLVESLPATDDVAPQPPRFEDYLQGEEQLAAQLASPMDAPTRAVLSANTRLAGRLDSEEARSILACNLTRILLGLTPLAIDLRLCAAARDHSGDMQRLKFFSHTSPVPGKQSFTDRARNFGVTSTGENIFAGSSDGVGVNNAWFHSPGHHRNMLGNHRRIGVGRSGVYFTQMFGS